MRTMRGVSMFMVIGAACIAGFVSAQGGPGRYYNTNTETALKGTVEKVTNIGNGLGWYGLHLTLKTQGQIYDVCLGPSNFISQSDFTFARGDQVEVWGSQIVTTIYTIVARAIEKNGKTLTLRDANGFPVWAGMGMRSGHGRGCGGCGCRGGCSGN